MSYHPPLRDLVFWLCEVLEAPRVLPAATEIDQELIFTILSEAGEFAKTSFDPLNQSGDREGCHLEEGKVTTPKGFKEAYHAFTQAGWHSVYGDAKFGGQGLPFCVTTALSELWSSANMALALCPLLSQSAALLMTHHASAELQHSFLPKLISGEWSGTMCLTESQAGSDVGSIQMSATPHKDHYLLRGTKQFITFGDHDLTSNILHFVLARTPEANVGSKGLSLFLVPKILLNPQGELGQVNDLCCLSLEHKLGIHGSPTALMAFGEKSGAIGYLIGQVGEGLKYMFTMMNHARLGVGVEGVAVAERCYQEALHYAKERIQGYRHVNKSEKVAIYQHPDIKRMLITMQAHLQSLRALGLTIALALDLAQSHSHPSERQQQQAIADLLVPVYKSQATEMGFMLTSLGMQIVGGFGYIEESGMPQSMRDSRITMIYEGTNGIQAIDLVTRKLHQSGGLGITEWIQEMSAFCADCQAAKNPTLKQLANHFKASIKMLSLTTQLLQQRYHEEPENVLCAATTYLRLLALVSQAYMLLRGASCAFIHHDTDPQGFYAEMIRLAEFFIYHQLPEIFYLSEVISSDPSSILQS